MLSRSVLSDYIKESKKITTQDRADLSYFLLNEATDYEIISLLVNNELPKKRYDFNEEVILFNQLKRLLFESYKILFKDIKKNKLKMLVDDLVPVSLYGLSTQKPILEFQLQEKFALTTKVGLLAGAAWLYKKAIDWYSDDYHQIMVKGIGGAALALAVIHIAYKMYQRYFSEAGRFCRGLSGKNKDECLIRYKFEGKKIQAHFLSKHLSNSSSNIKNMNTFKKLISQRVNKIGTKINKLRGKIK
jgi:hypothetical protein